MILCPLLRQLLIPSQPSDDRFLHQLLALALDVFALLVAYTSCLSTMSRSKKLEKEKEEGKRG